MKKKLIQLLYRSFDKNLSGKRKKQLEAALIQSTELKREKEQITAIRSAIASSAEKSFKPFFAERVMNRVKYSRHQEQASFFDSLVYIFKPVAIASVFLIVIMFSYNWLAKDNASLVNAMNESELTLVQVLDPTYDLTLEK